ncbi:MAG: hypothetical protein PHV37_04205 [Candidatus Gastranaerophilales bacterium]|nr:hypothetical protein [Candidatus Gastranaerophilales bacterium]
MIKPIGSSTNQATALAFKQNETEEKQPSVPHGDEVIVTKRGKTPPLTAARITADKFQNAVTVYPIKGFKGSKNANFYEFLTMGMWPYLTGSLMMMATSNLVSKHFSQNAAKSAAKLGKKMALGVVLYGAAKNLSKKLIELPVKAKYGVDMNLAYKKQVNELPDSVDDKDLISNEYHKVFESVDFPRWDLLYDNKNFGENRNSYYDKVAKKMGYGENLQDSDQIVKPKIKELVTKTRTFSTLSSYLWAGTAVAFAMQKPWENLNIAHLKNFNKGTMFSKPIEETIKASRLTRGLKSIGKTAKESAIQLWQGGENKIKTWGIAGKALLLSAVGVTLLGNIITLTDPAKNAAKKAASTPIIDDSKEKVVC